MTAAPQLVPLKHVTSHNDETLPETTNPETPIKYIEISDVQSQVGIVNSTSLTFGDAPSRARRIIRTGDVLVSTVRTYLRAIASVGESHDGYIASTGFCVLRANAILPSYLKYAASSPDFVEAIVANSTGVSYPAINASDLVRLPISVPDQSTQHRITTFLDHETAHIDALIAKQERLTELLAEKRQATITQAVTKGLDASAPTKPSGIPFMGEVPSSWKVSRLGTWILRSIEGGYSPSASNEYPEDEDWGVLALGAVGRADFFGGKVKSVDLGTEVPESLVIRQGDILLTRSNVRDRVGFAAVVDQARPRTIFPDLIYRLHVTDSVDPDYLVLFLSSRPARAQIESNARGSSDTMPKISHDQIRSWLIPLPPVTTQQEIVRHAQKDLSRMNELSQRAVKAIELLKERRSALISAAVTGKIDVREGAA